jgi:hypothetical protein
MQRLRLKLQFLDSRLQFIIALFIFLAATWLLIYGFGGKRFYAPGASGLLADLFKSVGSNLAFFGLFGLATLIPSFIQPRLEPIERRLGFLITSSRVSSAAQTYIRGEITRICGYVETSEIRIRVRGKDAGTGALNVEQRSYSTFRNTFESEEYYDPGFMTVVHSDICIDGKFGGIDIAEFVTINGREEILDVPVELADHERFEKTVALRIPANGTTDYRMHCWIWYNPSLMYYLYNHRYVEDARVDLHNDLDVPVRVNSPLQGGGIFTVPPKTSVELFRGSLEPGQCQAFRLEG